MQREEGRKRKTKKKFHQREEGMGKGIEGYGRRGEGKRKRREN